jgi:hypothetical protein
MAEDHDGAWRRVARAMPTCGRLCRLLASDGVCGNHFPSGRRSGPEPPHSALAARGNSRFGGKAARRINELRSVFRGFSTSTTGC